MPPIKVVPTSNVDMPITIGSAGAASTAGIANAIYPTPPPTAVPRYDPAATERNFFVAFDLNAENQPFFSSLVF